VDNPSGSNGGNGSSDGSDNGSSRLNAQGGSDNGSGNQVSAWFVCERFRESFFWRPWTVGNIVGVLGASSVCLEEEGQATSQEKGANLGKLGCLVAVVTMHARCVNGPGRGSGVRTGRACRVV
jgi:pseudo-response regulator 7